MFDLNLIRDNFDCVCAGLEAKGISIDLLHLLTKDKSRRDLMTQLDALRNQKNCINDEISKLLKAKQNPKERISELKKITSQIDELEPEVKILQNELHQILLMLPNLAHASVPVGGVEFNAIARSWGQIKNFSFKPHTHIELAERLDIIDFKRATKITGSNFILYKNAGARLERALLNFMLDLHTSQHGYKEVLPPVLVNRDSMIATGQLPKMEEDMYRLKDDDLFLIPTAEVPVTNIHRDEILEEGQLPIYYTAYTPCFRREAGSYGKDTKGLMRVHQFDKVELVKFVKPETSYDELEKLVANAERVFQLLELPYRVVTLASGDLSFAAAKCYDIEVHAPGLNKWLEVSSCSNFEAFQARRANIRYRGKADKKINFVHTLNGSGVALARTVIGILENYQTENGEIIIPKVLVPYMGGMTKIVLEQ